MELAYFGAKVIHPQTMAPAVERDIPIWIKNTFAPDAPGHADPRSHGAEPAVKGITTVERIALVNLEGAGMIGVPGTAHRLFGALREEGISVILISQGSSEHSICFAVPRARGGPRRARRAPRVRARAARRARSRASRSTAAAASSPWSATAWPARPASPRRCSPRSRKASVNVRAIAQGASERNISVVIDGRRQRARAARGARGFYLSAQTLSIGLIGPGIVGGALLDQVRLAGRAAAPRLQARPARARHRGRRSDAARAGLDRPGALAGRVRGAAATGRTSSGSPPTCTPTTCRTR